MKLVTTKDSSHTLYIPELDETYHSRNGAIEEAAYVYIGRGLTDYVQQHNKSSITILEIGFGTGLNAWLTAIKCETLNLHCVYHTIETFPLAPVWISQLNYTHHSPVHTPLYGLLHEAPWHSPTPITPNFELSKFEISLQSFIPQQGYDIIYFDAFAPEKQPELWTEECFQKLYRCLNPNGVMVTYSSKGAVKRLWKQIGFDIERLPGPPFKRHMLRGTKRS